MSLWVRKEPLCWIIVPKNTPKILLKPEALPSQTLHNSLNCRDQGGLGTFPPNMIFLQEYVPYLAFTSTQLMSGKVWDRPFWHVCCGVWLVSLEKQLTRNGRRCHCCYVNHHPLLYTITVAATTTAVHWTELRIFFIHKIPGKESKVFIFHCLQFNATMNFSTLRGW